MQDLDEQGRREPPIDGDENSTILGFLDYQRATLEWKCNGLDTQGLGATIHPSTMTLGGLLKHMAWVEHHWFSGMLLARPSSAPWNEVDWAADSAWEWHSSSTDTPDELRELWNESVDRSRAAVCEALASGGIGQQARKPGHAGQAPSRRWIVGHTIEEYARHNAHADLLREAVDGVTGE